MYFKCWIVEFVPAVGHGLSDIRGTVTDRLFTPQRRMSHGTFENELVLSYAFLEPRELSLDATVPSHNNHL